MKNQIIKNILKMTAVVAALAALTQTASANPHAPSLVPDASSSAGLMSLACGAMAFARKFRR